MRKSLMLFVFIMGLCIPGMAMQVAVSDNDRMGQSDLIAVGTVVSDTRIPDVDYWRGGVVVIKIDQVLRGQKVDQITAIHAVPPIMPRGMIMMDHGGFNLTVGQKQIFFLQNGPDNFNFNFGFQAMQPITEIEKYKNMIAMFPYQAVLQTPIDTFYFNKPVTVTVSVKNTGTYPIKLNPLMLEGKFYSPKMESFLQFEEVKDEKQDPKQIGMLFKQQEPVVVKAGEEGKITAKFMTKKPASWQLFSADTYFQTPVMVRARVFITIDAPVKAGQRQEGFYLSTNYTTVLTGFPLTSTVDEKKSAPVIDKTPVMILD